MIVVVMGVSGCGKSSVGQAIATRMGWNFIEGDDLHPAANRQKMASGTPLDDEDRWPWLDKIAGEARAVEARDGHVVVACSALKRAYRDRLRGSSADTRFVYLVGDAAIIEQRMQARNDHFMPPGLLKSQLATLEPPGADEGADQFDIAMPVGEIAQAAIARLLK